jgi:hypothetical protein
MSIVVTTTVTYRTALDVIKRSMRMLGVYPMGEEPSADEARDCLTALNALMGTLSNTGLVYAKTLDTIALSAGDSSLTIGPSGDTVSDRPVQVLPQSYILLDDVSYPVEILTLQRYNALGVKDTQGIPCGIWPQMGMENVTLTLWPVPDQAMTLKLWSVKEIATFTALNTQVLMPPGYEDALAYLLAEAIAPEYERPLPREVERGVGRSRRLLKRTNLEVPQLSMPAEVLGYPQFVDIRQV